MQTEYKGPEAKTEAHLFLNEVQYGLNEETDLDHATSPKTRAEEEEGGG